MTPRFSSRMMERVVAVLLGVGVLGLLAVWPFPGIGPEVWEDFAGAAGVRPPQHAFPGLWRLLMAGLVSGFGLPATLKALPWIGRVLGAFSAMMVFGIFAHVLHLVLAPRLSNPRWHARIGRMAVLLGALVVVASEPFVLLFQTFRPVSLDVTLALVATVLFFRFLRTASLGCAALGFFIVGLLAADTPVGFVLLVAFLLAGFLCQSFLVNPEMPYLNPFSLKMSQWRLSLLFALGLFPLCLGSLYFFFRQGGVEAAGWTLGEGTVALLADYAMPVWNASTIVGWLAGIFIVMGPCVLTMRLVPSATDPDNLLSLRCGLAFVICGLVETLVVLGPRLFRFWSWGKPCLMESEALQLVFVVFAALTVLFSLAVLGVEAYGRNHYFLGLVRFPELLEDAPQLANRVAMRKRSRRWRRLAWWLVPLAFMALTIPNWRQTARRAAQAILMDGAAATVREASGSRFIFTDGSFDPLLEILTAVSGGTLYPVSMMAGAGSYEAALRVRGAADSEDKLLLKDGASVALRTWMESKPARLKDSALQLGFELWHKKGASPPPPLGGFTGRPGGFPEGVQAEGLAQAAALAERIGDFYRMGVEAVRLGMVGAKLEFLQWRLARLARLGAERVQGEAQRTLLMRANALDEDNVSMQDMLARVNWISAQQGEQLTPREGLRVALTRADFQMARRFAIPILNANPDDPDANFGMGMSYFMENNFLKAERYLLRVLVSKPDEPVVLNNLAIIRYRLKRFDEALQNAEAAFLKLPDSPEIKATLDEIKKQFVRTHGSATNAPAAMTPMKK